MTGKAVWGGVGLQRRLQLFRTHLEMYSKTTKPLKLLTSWHSVGEWEWGGRPPQVSSHGSCAACCQCPSCLLSTSLCSPCQLLKIKNSSSVVHATSKQKKQWNKPTTKNVWKTFGKQSGVSNHDVLDKWHQSLAGASQYHEWSVSRPPLQ